MITTAPISSAGLPQLIESRLVTVRLRLGSRRGSLSMVAGAHCRTSSRLLRDAGVLVRSAAQDKDSKGTWPMLRRTLRSLTILITFTCLAACGGGGGGG